MANSRGVIADRDRHVNKAHKRQDKQELRIETTFGTSPALEEKSDYA
jgi:uncharacterized protein HemY